MSTYCQICGHLNSPDVNSCEYCDTPLARSSSHGILATGTIIKSRYKVKKLIKIGGMAVVYLGEAIDSGILVAIKGMFTKSAGENANTFVTRFEQEAKLLSELSHPNLPKVSDYFFDHNSYFMIMDYIEGFDLERVLERDGNPGLPEDKIIEWGIQLCSVLVYLHNYDPPILYRDIKPSNIVIREKDNCAILIDFGIARTLEAGVSAGKTVIGTVGYSPPEQYEGRQKPQSDLYALGATLHHLLTGKFPEIPFDFAPVTKLNPRVSKSMESVVMKALENDMENRFTSAEEMRDALVSVQSNKNIIIQKPQKRKKVKEEPELKTDPEISKGHSNLGVLYAKKGYYTHAGKEFDKSIELDKNSAEAYCNRGYISLIKEEYDEATKYFRQSIKLNPKLSAAHCNLGVIYNRKGRVKEAIEEFKKALSIDPNLTNARVNLAHIYGSNKMYNDMMEECKKAIQIQPDSIGAYINYAYACGKMGNYEDGIRKLEKALMIDSKNPVAYSNLGVLYGEVNDYDKAITSLNNALAIDSSLAEAHSNLGVIYHKKGDKEHSIKSFKNAIEVDPNFQQAKVNLIYSCKDQKLTQEEKKELKEIINTTSNEIIPEKVEFTPRAMVYEEETPVNTSSFISFEDTSEKDREKKILEMEVTYNVNDLNASIKLGNFYMDNDMTDDAIKQYQHAIRIQPGNVDAHYRLGLAYEKKGHNVLAESEYKKVIRLDHRHFNTYERLGNVSFNKNDLDGAINYYLKAINLDGSSSKVYFGIGKTYKKMGKYKQSIAAFESALQRDPSNVEVYFNLGLVYYESGISMENGERYLKQAISKKPDYADAHLYLGNIYYKKKMLSEALKHYKEAIDLNADHAISYSNLGAVYTDMDIFDRAYACYLKALQINENLPEAHLNLGILYQKQKNYEEAINEMKIYLTTTDTKDLREVHKKIQEMEGLLKNQKNEKFD